MGMRIKHGPAPVSKRLSVTVHPPRALSSSVCRHMSILCLSSMAFSGFLGTIGLEDMTRVIRDVSACSGLPLLADADTGGEGGEGGVRRVVMEYRRAGAAALHVEDQVFPKRCGHLEGKELVPADEFALKVQAAARARDEGRVAGEEGGGNGGLMICARTDARSVVGVEEVIERAKRYVDAGADMIFPEGLCSGDEFLRVSQALKGYNGVNGGEGPYLLANMTEFGKTPLLSVRRMGALGYHATIFPMTLFRWAMRGVVEALEELREGGRVSKTALREGRLLTREETYELLGYTPGRVWEYPNANSYSRRKGTRRSDFVQEGKEVMEEEDENEASGYGEEDPKKK